MKTPLKSMLVALSIAVLAAFAFSACESNGGHRSSTSGTHQMGPAKTPTQMSNREMPGR